MKTIIAGGRELYEDAKTILDLMAQHYEITEVVSGGARGADRAGEEWAKENNVKLTIMKADWNQFGRSAGPIRNKAMADYIGPKGQLVLIWDGESRGSSNMKMNAEKAGIPVIEHVIVK